MLTDEDNDDDDRDGNQDGQVATAYEPLWADWCRRLAGRGFTRIQIARMIGTETAAVNRVLGQHETTRSVPAWVPQHLAPRYVQISAVDGEHAAANWARKMKALMK